MDGHIANIQSYLRKICCHIAEKYSPTSLLRDFKVRSGRTNFCFAVTKLTGGGSSGESSSVLVSSLLTSLNDFLNFSGFLLAP